MTDQERYDAAQWYYYNQLSRVVETDEERRTEAGL